MPRMNYITRNNTTITEGENERSVTLHSTKIVTVKPDEIILNTGGWETVTTKTRMNQVANTWNLPYKVFQKDYEWYVRDRRTGAVEEFGNVEGSMKRKHRIQL